MKINDLSIHLDECFAVYRCGPGEEVSDRLHKQQLELLLTLSDDGEGDSLTISADRTHRDCAVHEALVLVDKHTGCTLGHLPPGRHERGCRGFVAGDLLLGEAQE